tara:strand:+ start:2518 stop:2757 length:240 start_codon:yes stop_codon:yes gene_type:complete
MSQKYKFKIGELVECQYNTTVPGAIGIIVSCGKDDPKYSRHTLSSTIWEVFASGELHWFNIIGIKPLLRCSPLNLGEIK